MLSCDNCHDQGEHVHVCYDPFEALVNEDLVPVALCDACYGNLASLGEDLTR